MSCGLGRSYDGIIIYQSKNEPILSFPFAESPNENDTVNASGDTLSDTLNRWYNAGRPHQQHPDSAPGYDLSTESLFAGRATIARTMKRMIGDGLGERSGSKKTGE